MGGSGPICLPISCHFGQSSEVAGLPVQDNHSDCSRVAQDALILGSSHHAKRDPLVLAQSAQPANTAFQPDSSQESVKPKFHDWLLESHLSKNKASLRQWQHELRLLKEDQLDPLGKMDHFYKLVPQ